MHGAFLGSWSGITIELRQGLHVPSFPAPPRPAPPLWGTPSLSTGAAGVEPSGRLRWTPVKSSTGNATGKRDCQSFPAVHIGGVFSVISFWVLNLIYRRTHLSCLGWEVTIQKFNPGKKRRNLSKLICFNSVYHMWFLSISNNIVLLESMVYFIIIFWGEIWKNWFVEAPTIPS